MGNQHQTSSKLAEPSAEQLYPDPVWGHHRHLHKGTVWYTPAHQTVRVRITSWPFIFQKRLQGWQRLLLHPNVLKCMSVQWKKRLVSASAVYIIGAYERKQESVGVFSETWRWEWQLASQTGESRITSVGCVCKSAARMLVNLCRTNPRCSPETDTGSSSPEPFLRAAEGSSSTYPCPLPRWAVTEKLHATYEGLKYSSPKNEHLLILRPSNQSWGHPQAISFFLQ